MTGDEHYIRIRGHKRTDRDGYLPNGKTTHLGPMPLDAAEECCKYLKRWHRTPHGRPMPGRFDLEPTVVTRTTRTYPEMETQ